MACAFGPQGCAQTRTEIRRRSCIDHVRPDGWPCLRWFQGTTLNDPVHAPWPEGAEPVPGDARDAGRDQKSGAPWRSFGKRPSRTDRSRSTTSQSRRISRARGKPKIRETKYWSSSMANGWSLEWRKRQSEIIRRWQPWQKSTGPKRLRRVKHARAAMPSRAATDLCSSFFGPGFAPSLI